MKNLKQYPCVGICKRISLSALFWLIFHTNSFAQPPLEISCIGNVNVSLDQACGRLVTPEMLFYGNWEAADEVQLEIDNTPSDYLTGCGTHTYQAHVYQAGEVVFSCWGDITARDMTPPLLICNESTTEAVILSHLQQVTGGLTEDAPTFDPSSYGCYAESSPALGTGTRHYDTYTFQVSSEDFFTIIPTAPYDGILAIYQGAFDPLNPCQNIIAFSNDTWIGSASDFLPVMPVIAPSLRLNLALRPNQDYTAVWTSRDENVTGAYTLAIYADNNGRILNLTKTQFLQSKTLVCLDVEEIYLDLHYTFSLHPDGSLILDYNDPYRIPNELRHILGYTGFPQVSDNCSSMLMTVHDDLTELSDCDSWVITRHFTITDRYQSDCTGTPLQSECVQTIIIRKPNMSDVVFPPLSTTVECDEGFTTDGLIGGQEDNPHPSLTGFPYLETATNFHNIDQSVCNLGASYTDFPRVSVCPGTYFFQRKWTVIDWCDSSSTVIFNQLIRVGDFTGPKIEWVVPDYDNDGSPDTLYRYPTTPTDCSSRFFLPTPAFSDGNGCAGILQTSASLFNEQDSLVWLGNVGQLVQLPPGDYQLQYCATDSCYNERCASIPLIIKDDIAPFANCNEAMTLSLNSTADNSPSQIFLTPADVDEGSFDLCSEVILEISRDASEWAQEVVFSCSDTEQALPVFLRVTDAVGNTNTCETTITIEDKINPICSPPPTRQIDCTDWQLFFPGDISIAYLSDFDNTSAIMNTHFGTANGSDNCHVDTIVERTPTIQVNDCGWGSITRHFEAWQIKPTGDANQNGIIEEDEVFISTNNCTQLIEIQELHHFIIDFPADAYSFCTENSYPTATVTATGCDVMVVNTSPIRFEGNNPIATVLPFTMMSSTGVFGMANRRDTPCPD
ncbi:MAG: hypothetical protein R2795_16870 [Saprospiraceae bacterium]